MSAALSQAVAGCCGSLFSTTCIYPLELIRTRIQATGTGGEKVYDGMAHAFLQIVKNEGWIALYTGMSTMYFKEALKTFVYIYWYEQLKKLARLRARLQGRAENGCDRGARDIETGDASKGNAPHEDSAQTAGAGAGADGGSGGAAAAKKEELGIALSLAIGCLAGAVTQLIVNPINVIHTRITTNSVLKGDGAGRGAGVWATVAHVWKHEGLGGLYKGIGASMVLTTNPAIQFVIFDKLKMLVLRARGGGQDLEPFEALLIGIVAKLVATFVTYPYIMAKVRIQSASKTGRAGGTFAVWRHVVREEGWTALYSGLRPQLLKSVLAAALMYMAKERIQMLVRRVVSRLRPPKATKTGSEAGADARSATGGAMAK